MVSNKKNIFWLLFFITSLGISQPDTLRLTHCYEQARTLSPLKQQELMHRHIYELNLKNHNTNYLPSLSLNGKGSYQSEVITIPGSSMIPEYPEIPKEQFQLSLDINQNIYDGGLTMHSKQVEESNYRVRESELETELYKLNSTINQLYFSILQLQENKRILTTTMGNLKNRKKQMEASVRNGVVLESNLFQIDKQILSLEQELITVNSEKDAMLIMLSEWIGDTLEDDVFLLLPMKPSISKRIEISRPENDLFQNQRALIESQRSMTSVERMPRLSAFAQGGIGQPNPMNFFEVDPSTYYILGLRFNWSIYDWGDVSRKKQVLNIHKDILSTRESDFNRNINISLTRLFSDISKLEEVIEKDEEIIALQKKITETAFSEFQHGIITSTEYLTEMNALTEAEIKMALHVIQLSNTYVNIYTLTGQEF